MARRGSDGVAVKGHMNWYIDCAYNDAQKRSFHATAQSRLRALAIIELQWEPSSFDIRSNKGGIAVSGEVTLHHDNVYVQVSQPYGGFDTGILIRTCNGRRDYTGGVNHFAPLSMLDDIPALATRVRAVMTDAR